jgi:uncharacterized lipoprotein YmbA
MRRTWLSAAAVLLISGCGHSPSTQFFTLMPVRPDRQHPPVALGPVQVRVVHIPELLDRPQRVVQSSPERLDIIEQQRWGAPLNDMVRRILTEDLTARLPPGAVLAPEVPAPPGARGIVIYIEEFQPEPEGRVVLEVSWSVLAAGAGAQRTAAAAAEAREMRRFEVSAASDPDAQVAAMSRLLGQLADAIVATLAHRS